MPPLTDVRDISRIAYGFMASKALFAALNLDLFSRLKSATKSVDALAAETGVARNRLATLIAALTSAGLLVRHQEGYANAPASERYLVRGAAADFGDYYRFQVDRQIYPSLVHLDAGLAGDRERLAPRYAEFDAARADDFTRAQHAGSLGPAALLARTVDLTGRGTLLDVAGGSGAFSITLCRRYPDLRATLVDFPNVVETARRFVGEAELTDRIALVGGDALTVEWPGGQDVVLMSYLLSAVPGPAIPTLLDRAWAALRPGGLLLVHDFMLDDDGDGPALAAGWFLVYVAWDTETVSFRPRDLRGWLGRPGFVDVADQPLVHDITRLVVARRPG